MGDEKVSNDQKPQKSGKRMEGARFALFVLTAINLLNYMDRYVPSSVKELIKEDLHLTDAETAYPLTGMILVYMIVSPIFGHIADKQLADRRLILCLSIAFWSIATAAAGLANDLWSLVILRSLVGVGEAAYVVIATPMLADMFPPQERNIVLGIFYMAIPVGAALGFLLGGTLGSLLSWRYAFLICGIPGLFVSFSTLYLKDPGMGANDKHITFHSPRTLRNEVKQSSSSFTPRDTDSQETVVRTAWTDYKEILSNVCFLLCLAGITANCFAAGALADWLPTFFARYHGYSLSSAGLVCGAATVIGGIGGMFLGAWAADRYKYTIKSSYFFFPALFSIPAAITATIAIHIDSDIMASLLVIIAQLFMWTYTSPIGALSIQCLHPSLRARSVGLQIFIQHILGDVISPPIVGSISDASGSLRAGIQILPIAIGLCSVFWFLGICLVPESIIRPIMEHKGESPTFYKVLCARNTFDDDDDVEDDNDDESEYFQTTGILNDSTEKQEVSNIEAYVIGVDDEDTSSTEMVAFHNKRDKNNSAI